MGAIGPGDWVVSVRDGERVRRGELYFVSAVRALDPRWFAGCLAHGVGCRSLGCRVRGIAPENDSDWLCADLFAPIYRPKQELIDSLLAGTDHRVPA